MSDVYRRALPALAVCALAIPPAASTARAQTQDSIPFIGVAWDAETRGADERLIEYLQRRTNLNFANRGLDYGPMIDTLVEWSNRGERFLARATPYVLVSAEMLGARLEVIATYLSQATRKTTYRSYFVVNRNAFSTPPDLQDLVAWLRERREPATFIYHNKFSTSSYFLPTIFLRSQRIFVMEGGGGGGSTTPILSQKLGDSSSGLVRAVARGDYDLAAVWDGTMIRFSPVGIMQDSMARSVYFIPLPTPLPNDLLVASSNIGTLREPLQNAIRNMSNTQISTGDFVTWRDITGSDAARALADLRQVARQRAAPVTVRVVGTGGIDEKAVDAVRQAVRLSGTELVLFDPDLHLRTRGDFQWTLRPIHDGAVELTSTIPGSNVEPQTFQISFASLEDLTRRTGVLIHSRLHRIRYVWPYDTTRPTVIRDVDFSLPIGATVDVQKIAWEDPQKNLYTPLGQEFESEVVSSDFYKFQLADFADIQLGSGESAPPGFDPLSNVSYRVILVRPERERVIFRVFTVLLIALLVFAAIAAVTPDFRALPRTASALLSRFRKPARSP